MFLINSIILRAPKDSVVLTSALKIRGQLFYRECSLECASKDYEMFMHICQFATAADEDICEVMGHLVICMYMMGHYAKAKNYSEEYRKYKAKLSPKSLQRSCFVQIEKQLANFKNEYLDACNTISHLITDTGAIEPFKKCSENGYGTMKSDCDLKRGEIIFIENPLCQSVKAPLIRCEICYRLCKQQIYKCLDCHYKTYCSLNCMEKNRAEHAIECLGYKQLTLLILDASLIYRIFVQVSKVLDKGVFKRKPFRKANTALDVWFHLLEYLNQRNFKDENQSYMTLLAMKPRYDVLSEIQYSTLITTAFRLAIFIDTKTNLIESFYERLQISSKQKLIIIGSLLMRIHCNLLLNTFDFEIRDIDMQQLQGLTNEPEQFKNLIDSSKNQNDDKCLNRDLNDYYKVDIDKEIWQRCEQNIKSNERVTNIKTITLTPSTSKRQPNRLYSILSIYKDHIAELYFNPELINKYIYGQQAEEPLTVLGAKVLCSRLAQMSDIQRYYFVKKFARLFHSHYIEYFMQLSERNETVPQLINVYAPILQQFEYSCKPNVEIIVMDNGVILGKSLKTIKKGEPLYVTYNSNVMFSSHCERQQFLKQVGTTLCHCEYCTVELQDPTNLRSVIYCDKCIGMVLAPNLNKCPQCNTTQYNTLLTKYRTRIRILEDELDRQLKSRGYQAVVNDRDIYISHLTLYLYAKKYFGPQNEYRINIELKHARYLACKNFITQAHDLLVEIRINILQSYDEHYIWFTFYSDILTTIKIIICYNIDERLCAIAAKTLMQLCDFAIYIVKGQIDILEFYEIFDRKCSTVLADLKRLLVWKEQLTCKQAEQFVLPLKDLKSQGQ
ncbi:uncharacterized protein isoform X2 [Musca autumnalis]